MQAPERLTCEDKDVTNMYAAEQVICTKHEFRQFERLEHLGDDDFALFLAYFTRFKHL